MGFLLALLLQSTSISPLKIPVAESFSSSANWYEKVEKPSISPFLRGSSKVGSVNL